MLMLSRSNPASLSFGSFRASTSALVVMATVSKPGRLFNEPADQSRFSSVRYRVAFSATSQRETPYNPTILTIAFTTYFHLEA